MKKLTKSAAVLFLGVFILFSSFMPQGNKWDLLGTRGVKWTLDHDEILVTASEGKFDALKVKILHGNLNMKKMVVHFKNGGKQEIELRNNFKAGSESRVINLTGDDRIIRKVDFWYETKNHSKKSIVQLWGKH